MMIHLLLTLALLGGSDQPPRLVLGEDQALRIALPVQLLDEPAINRQLTSGLTTSWLVTVVLRSSTGGEQRGATRVDIRFEPWDELFHIRLFPHDGNGTVLTETLSRAELVSLLTEPNLIATVLPRGAWRGRLMLEVLPFSDVEEEGAREWFARSLARAEGGSPGVFDRLYAASIKRKAQLRHVWEVEVTP